MLNKQNPLAGDEAAQGAQGTTMNNSEPSAATGIGQGLAERCIFVPYRLVWNAKRGKMDKIPHSDGRNGLSTSNPAHWMTMAEAQTLAADEQRKLDGIGLVFTGGITEGDYTLIGFDWDGITEDFKPPFKTYTEVSPSGNGARGFAWAPTAWAQRFRDATNLQPGDCDHVEIYLGTSARFLTVTFDAGPYVLEPIAQLTQVELAVIESWGLKPAETATPVPTVTDIGSGQAFDLKALHFLNTRQCQMLNGEIPEGQRNEVVHGLLIKLIDAGRKRENIKASVLQNEALLAYFSKHNNAAKFADEEIERAYKKSDTYLRDRLFGAPVTSTVTAVAEDIELVAQHLCTDQANAVRLKKAIGAGVMFSAGRWYVWLGTHWGADKPAAMKLTCNLSLLVKLEADEWDCKAYASVQEQERNQEIAKSLRKHSAKCEDLRVIGAAFKLLELQVSVPADSLNRDPYALNVVNGTIDLRTGKLRPHDKADLITHCIPVFYDPKADAPKFKKALAEIAGGSKPLAEFLQRWFGYCATGVTTEQKFAVHHGDGANGKSLLLDTISSVLGPYAGVAAPNLLIAGSRNRHPTELADLFGMRLTVAHESGEGCELDESTVKSITGGDWIKARYCGKDHFQFPPTHTLNLLTNHKPQIRGQDMGIWRRVLLVPYSVTFGTKAEVEQGLAHFERNDRLGEALKAEAAGILTWLVQGAVKWYAIGLNPPDVVLSAGAEYRSEQDRVGEFITEHCELDRDHTAPCDMTYLAYKQWELDCTGRPMPRMKFYEAMAKRPGITKERKRTTWMGEPRHCECFTGVKLIRMVVRPR